MERPFSFVVHSVKLTAFSPPLPCVDVRLDHAQQGTFSHQLHRDRREPPACCRAADPAQPLCYELHGKTLSFPLLCTHTCTETHSRTGDAVTSYHYYCHSQQQAKASHPCTTTTHTNMYLFFFAAFIPNHPLPWALTCCWLIFSVLPISLILFSCFPVCLNSASSVMSCHSAVPIIDPYCLRAPPIAVCCPLLLCSTALPALPYLTVVCGTLLLTNKYSWGRYTVSTLQSYSALLC